MARNSAARGISVVAAGTGINLALGVLYAWSVFKGAIKQSIQAGGAGAFQWDLASLNDPYAVCCIVFACMMIVAGRCQDRYGPRVTALVGGVLVGAGFVWLSQSVSYLVWVLGFGVVVGTGIAFGYSAATPPALKWFSPTLTGRVSGIVVAGFGLASVYIAPLGQHLLGTRGIQGSMLVLGIGFFLAVTPLALLLANPPPDYVPAGFVERRGPSRGNGNNGIEDLNARPGEMIRSPFFWLLWTLYFIGAGAGLMVIGSMAGMAKVSLGRNAFLAVAILAVGNAAGRIGAGVLSDRIGRKKTLFAIFACQTLLMFAAIPITGSEEAVPALVVLLATLVGFNYGANLALFPSFAKDLWGMKHFGVNYGVLFTAWGLGGLVMSKVSEHLAARNGSLTPSFIAAGALLALGSLVIVFMRDKKEEMRREMRLPLSGAHAPRV